MKSSFIEITAEAGNRKTAESFLETKLKRSNLSPEIRTETMRVFDALFSSLLRQGYEKETPVTVSTSSRFGEIDITLGFEEKPFDALSEEPGVLTEEDRILEEFEDKYDCSYQDGYNLIHLVVQRSFQNTVLVSLASILLAVLVYLPVQALVRMEDQIWLGEEIVFPLVKLFANAMLMIGAPVTFFSLLKNFTDIYIISKRNSAGRRL